MLKQHCWKYKSGVTIKSQRPFCIKLAYFPAVSNCSYVTLKVNCVGIAVMQMITVSLCRMNTFRQCCLVALSEIWYVYLSEMSHISNLCSCWLYLNRWWM